MPGEEDLLRSYATHAAQSLPPLIEALCDRLGVADDAELEAVSDALAEAFMAGADAGQSEMMAHAAAQGVDLRVE